MTNVSFNNSIKKLQWPESLLSHTANGCDYILQWKWKLPVAFALLGRTMVSGHPQGYVTSWNTSAEDLLCGYCRGPWRGGEFFFRKLRGSTPIYCTGRHGFHQKWWLLEFGSLSMQLTLQHWFSFFLVDLFLLLPSGIEHMSTESKTVFQEGFCLHRKSTCLLLLRYQYRRMEMLKLGWSLSSSHFLFNSGWCAFIASSICILLLLFYRLLVFLLVSNPVFCLFALLSFPLSSFKRKSSLLGREKGQDREEQVLKTKVSVMSWSFSWAGWFYLQHTSGIRSPASAANPSPPLTCIITPAS